MKLNEYIEYIRNPLADAKSRVVIVPPGEGLTTLHRFSKEHGAVELRLSNLVREDAWLPMPDEIFERVCDAMKTQATNDEPLVLLGLFGYLALLADEHKRSAIFALREWVDSTVGREAVCILRSDDSTRLILREIFANPRYCQGKQLVEIEIDQAPSLFTAGRAEVMLVGKNLVSLIPEECDTFQKYLRYTEDHPSDCSAQRIVIASEKRLPGLNAEVRQLVCLRDFAHVIYNVEDARLSENALLLMCELGKKAAGTTLPETLKSLFFPEGQLAKRILRVFDGCKDAEREVVLWLVKQVASKGSYLECVARQEEVLAHNFRSTYVSGAIAWLDKAGEYADERRNAMQEAGISMSNVDIQAFIARCAGESTSRVAPWLNCGTYAERAELLRRCAVDGIVSNAVKAVYPETAAYMNTDPIFDDAELDKYFTAYRNLRKR